MKRGTFSLPAFIRILVILDENKIQIEIAKDLNITYSHVSHIIKQLEEKEIIKKEKDGRKEKIILTKKGECLVKDAKKLYFNLLKYNFDILK